MRKIVFGILIVLFVVALCAACAPARPVPGTEGGFRVVATIFPLYDFARAVAGDKAEVSMLLKPGAESHSYDPPPADIIKIKDAGLFLYIGGESDKWVSRILDSLDGSENALPLLESVEAVEEEMVEGMEAEAEEEGGEEAEGPELDEHIWTSPKNAIVMVSAIADALGDLDPANAEYYQKNAAAYNEQIAALDAEFTEIVSGAKRHMLVFGDRFPFRYFADAYGLTYRAAFPGCSTETEASAGTLAYLMDLVKNENMPYIYYIELSNENIARAIAEQTGAEAVMLHSCQKISKEDFEAGRTYVELMRQNAEQLRKGLN